MWWRSFRRLSLPAATTSFLPRHHGHGLLLCRRCPTTNQFRKPKCPFTSSTSPSLSYFSSSSPAQLSSTHLAPTADANEDDDDAIDYGDASELLFDMCSVKGDETLERNIDRVMSTMREFTADAAEAKRRLDECGVPASPDLVSSVLSRLRNDWSASYTFFLWAGRQQPCYSHSSREYHAMISILGKFRRFDTAWTLVHEMRGGIPSRPGAGIITPQTLMILIRRFCAAHEVARGIGAFYSLKKFGFTPGVEEFHGLLSALCRYKNVADAEHLLLCNEAAFPFETKSFNIILNGWCNVLVVVREAKRFWKSMENRGIPKDVVSYSSMISCFSKAGNLSDVLKLFSKIKDSGIEPDRKVYNAVVYALAKAKCIKEAKELMKTMEEKGIAPNAVTFNSLIRPLCKALRVEDARELFDEMLKRGITPSLRTFHSFFRVSRTTKEVFDILDLMKRSGCAREIETYIMLIRKLCRWQQHEKAFELWDDICKNGPSPDRSAYIVLIHGLFLNGKLQEAHRYYEQMKEKGFSPEPRTDEMIQAWLSGREIIEDTNWSKLETKQVAADAIGQKTREDSSCGRARRNNLRPEIRNVSRERGFSL